MGVILAHFLYGNKDRLTPRKALGCALGFGGVLVATLGNHGGGSVKGMAFMLIASVIFALAGPWNKAVTQHADSFSVCSTLASADWRWLFWALRWAAACTRRAPPVSRCCCSLRSSQARGMLSGRC
ncbi:hypothetical protein [Gemmiger formicilis]|uniref:hypothetical protein n=1 Tax=Gemmiger formicilis TaxID=745368 RepID=UPI003CCA831C